MFDWLKLPLTLDGQEGILLVYAEIHIHKKFVKSAEIIFHVLDDVCDKGDFFASRNSAQDGKYEACI